MKIAVISDIHENFHNLAMFFREIEGQKIEKIIFLGDFMNGGIAEVLASLKVPIISIWGNNDGDKVAITKTAMSEGSNLTVGFDTFDFLNIDNKRIFITHYPLLAKPMAKSGDFDAVFYGHNHKKNIDKVGDCLIANPGEISAHKTGKATFLIYDTASNDIEAFEVKDSISTKTKESKEHLEKIKFVFGKNKTHQY